MTSATYNTTERYLEFVTEVTNNPELSSRLEAANDAADMVALAASAGYIFTADELKSAAHEARIMVDSNDGELSEEALEAVAGGLSWSSFKKAFHYVRKAVDWIDNKLN